MTLLVARLYNVEWTTINEWWSKKILQKKQSWPSDIYLDGLSKTRINPSQYSRCPSLDSNRAFPEQYSSASPLLQTVRCLECYAVTSGRSLRTFRGDFLHLPSGSKRKPSKQLINSTVSFLVWLTLQPRRWTAYVHPICLQISAEPHGVTAWKLVLSIVTAVSSYISHTEDLHNSFFLLNIITLFK
jgi:hypothetical protein